MLTCFHSAHIIQSLVLNSVITYMKKQTVSKDQVVNRVLEAWMHLSDRSYGKLMVAICHTQIGDYPQALYDYRFALLHFLENRQDWYGTSQPNLFIDTFVMANQPGLYSKVKDEIETYKQDRRGSSLAALYSYALLHLLAGQDKEALNYVPGLLKYPKVKDFSAIGEMIRALGNDNASGFDDALMNLLIAHRGMAKFGSLRETPEGILCLPAMSLSKIALERGLYSSIENGYLSRGYLAYLNSSVSE